MAGKSAQEGFNRFVEDSDQRHGRDAPLDASRKDFWDDFSSLADERRQSTSAMGMGKGRGGRGCAGAEAGGRVG